MQVFAQLHDDSVVVLSVSPSETAGETCRRLGACEASRSRLVKGGRTLPDDCTLGECGVVSGDTLWLQGRLRGGSSEKKKKLKGDEGDEEGKDDDDGASFFVNIWNLASGKTQG